MTLAITGGRVLTDAGLADTALTIDGTRITRLADSQGARIDATGLLVLPGIVDLHGDAFERQMQPRPGIGFPIDLALAETEGLSDIDELNEVLKRAVNHWLRRTAPVLAFASARGNDAQARRGAR